MTILITQTILRTQHTTVLSSSALSHMLLSVIRSLFKPKLSLQGFTTPSGTGWRNCLIQ